jgi:hypothetical protein
MKRPELVGDALRLRRIGLFLLPYLVLVVIHLLSGLQMEQPIILADEVGYLGNARYLSGTAHLPNMGRSQFYHFGYSLLLLPAFWLFTEPISIYKAAITINALLAGSLYFPLCYILESFLDVPGNAARSVAFTCCLYPSLILYSNFALSGNAVIPFYAIVAALFGMVLVSRSSRHAVLFGLLTGFLYTIHPRALPVVAIVVAYLVVLVLLKVVPKRQALLSATTIGAVFILTRIVNGHLKTMGWGGGGEFSATKLAGRLVPGSDFPLLLERAFGQILYLSQASHGLFLVGLVAALWWILKNIDLASPRRVLANPRTGVPIFVLMTASGVFVAACTAKLYSVHGPAGLRGADFIHGRYNETFAVLFIAFALAELGRTKLPYRRILLAAVGVAVTTLCLTAVVAIEVKDAQRRHDPSIPVEALEDVIPPSNVDTIAVPGVFPLVELLGGLNLYAMSLAAMGSFLLILVAMRLSNRVGMALLMLLFTSFILYNHRHYVSPANTIAGPRLTFASQLSRVGPIPAISYDAAYHEHGIFYGIQYLLPDTVFDRFDSRKREVPSSDAVISGNKWRQARRLGARFVVSSGWDNALWLLPGEMQSRLPTVSYEGVTLGAEPKFGVQEAGFYLPERFLGSPGRWTNGFAALKVRFDPEHPPKRLEIETIVPGRDGAVLQVLANRVELWHDRIPSVPWSRTFKLDPVPMSDQLLIELKSDTSQGGRRLGVVVRGVRLTAHDDRDAGAYEGLTLGVDLQPGFQESGFHSSEQIEGAPGRWTNGAATLKIPIEPKNPPRLVRIETVAPGREVAQLQVLANGFELWNEPVSAAPWSKTFRLEQVPMNDVLLIELRSDTFSPAERHPESPDVRRLGVAVRGIQLTARDRFDGPLR